MDVPDVNFSLDRGGDNRTFSRHGRDPCVHCGDLAPDSGRAQYVANAAEEATAPSAKAVAQVLDRDARSTMTILHAHVGESTGAESQDEPGGLGVDDLDHTLAGVQAWHRVLDPGPLLMEEVESGSARDGLPIRNPAAEGHDHHEARLV